MVAKKVSVSTVSTTNPLPVQEIKTEDVQKVKEIAVNPSKPRTTRRKKEVEEVITPPVEIVTEPVVEQPPVQEPITEIVVEDDDEIIEIVEEEKEKKRTRRVLTKESFYSDFETFVSQFNDFIEHLNKNENTKGLKTNSMVKKVKQLLNDSGKVLKLKHLRSETRTKMENNSGFMKPIDISKELAAFLGEKTTDDPITRVYVTKQLCKYIKENDLQNPQDRREILPDDKLKSLFKISDNTESEKLTYYSMQKAIQQHIFKI